MHETAPQFREPEPDAVGASRTASRFRRAGWMRLVRGGAIAMAAGLFLAQSGAFQSDGLPFAVRAAYWIGLLEFGTALNFAIDGVLGRSVLATTRPLLFAALCVLLLSVIMTPVVVAITDGTMRAGGSRLDTSAGTIVYIGLAVVVISAVLTAVNMLAERRPLQTHALLSTGPDAPIDAPAAAKFLDRLPPKLRGAELHAVEAEDHYLRLHTSRGSDLILMRLGDALGELDGIEGAQTHRSWWVAKAAVTEASRVDGRTRLTLASGAQAPVSRTYVKALREDGWF